MGVVWVHADSFLHCVASPFHSFVTIRSLGVLYRSGHECTVAPGHICCHEAGVFAARQIILRFQSIWSPPALLWPLQHFAAGWLHGCMVAQWQGLNYLTDARHSALHAQSRTVYVLLLASLRLDAPCHAM